MTGPRRGRVAARATWAAKVGHEGVKDAAHATRKAGEQVRDRAVNAAKDVLRTVRKPVRAWRAKRDQLQEHRGRWRTVWEIEDEIGRIVARGRPLVLGPWLSEVGYETLYWLPFLHWVKTAFRLDSDRLVAVSRGGVASWYSGLASRYVEIWEHIDPAEFARQNAARGVVKQHEISSLDREVLARVEPALGTSDCDVVHPSLMYRLFSLYWSGHMAMGFVDAHTRFTREAAPALIDRSLLPERYVAVKFYAARSLPDGPAMRATLRRVVTGLAERIPVVLLDTGLVLEDDHVDYELGTGGTVVSAKPWMTPQNNLGVQTQIVAGATAFVSTCGSLAWLGPRLGVDTSALYVDAKFLHAHLAVAMRAYHRLGAGHFAVADLRALDPLGAHAAD